MTEPTSKTTDLADELRQWAATTSPADPRGDLAEKAADEIDKLRAANRMLKDERSRLLDAWRELGSEVSRRTHEALHA